MSESRILVVDDEESIRTVLQKALEKDGHEVKAVGRGDEALEALTHGHFDVAIVDIRLRDVSGLDLLSRSREQGIEIPFVIITAESTMANAIEAMKRGAFDYLTKPFDLDEVRLQVRRALEMSSLSRMVDNLKDEMRPRYTPGEGLVGRTPAMQEIYKTIGRVAGTDATVLIEGESGTGKELIARAIHFHSARSGAFVAINCSAVPGELLESQLFGHERGAFTGAVDRQVGSFEQADKGTLFLDEIGDMPIGLQSKLLRVLQEREFTRVGGRETIRADVRILAAANQRLEQRVKAREFREDLYFRLNVVPIQVPPLRARRADIPELVRFFVDKINREMGTRIHGVSPDAEQRLVTHRWPGNVRELENTIRRACVLASGRTLTVGDFDLSEGTGNTDLASTTPLDELIRRKVRQTFDEDGVVSGDLHARVVAVAEKPLIETVLERTGGNQLRAAEILGINRNTLRKRITQLGIEIPRKD